MNAALEDWFVPLTEPEVYFVVAAVAVGIAWGLISVIVERLAERRHRDE